MSEPLDPGTGNGMLPEPSSPTAPADPTAPPGLAPPASAAAPGSEPAGEWRLTVLHITAVAIGILTALAAVLLHRPDLVVLAAPMLLVAAWGALARPDGHPAAAVLGTSGDVLEGQAVRVRAVTTGSEGAETVGHELGAGPALRVVPEGVLDLATTLRPGRPGATGVTPASDESPARAVTTSFTVQPRTWGPTELATGELHLRSAWGAWDARWRRRNPVRLTVAPAPGAFDADAPVPHPSTLLGAHGGRRRGDGVEFDAIREFRPGDRPRHVHWPTSARTGRLHVRTTLAENDTEVLLLVDAYGDLPGADGGSLDRTVHAAASVAAWCARTGDRVAMRVLGADVTPVPAGAGRRQLMRVLGTLARTVPDSDRSGEGQRMRLDLAPGTLVVVLSPLTERRLVDAAVERALTGLDVLVIDTAPLEPAGEDPVALAAWGLVRLERERTAEALRRRGVAVAAWRGPGTLDATLEALSARRSRR